MTDYRTQIVITLLVIQRFVHLILFLIKLESHLRQRYLWGPAVDQILAEENVDNGTDETVQWTLTDHLNTVRDIAKYDSGSDMTTVVNHLIYDAFGRVTSESNPAIENVFLFDSGPPLFRDSLFLFTARLV
ncbi:MAG: hypothetical protein KatS3mg112_1392 [Thermogutta sp.]|nr:MAG: hypothetical protein KatS3mg112_1392 [Thermogutta sp.]